MVDTPALAEAAQSALRHEVVQVPPPKSLEESAALQHLSPESIIKTLVVRRTEGDYLFVLVPGDRVIDWPKLRAHLGVSRLSMADPDEAKAVTGYPRGTITPFGSATSLPVIADRGIQELDPASIGGGARGVSIHARGPDLLDYLDAEPADITKPG